MPTGLLARNDRVMLCDAMPADADRWVHWQSEGAWRQFDAPWEALRFEPTPERLERVRTDFLASCAAEKAVPRQEALIATPDGVTVGWIRRYGDKRFPDVWMLGICIGLNDCFGRGYGAAALDLWIDYLFANSTIHRLGLATYSFNARMLRVAEKVGFQHEGTERQVIQWQGHWVDRVSFGLLRDEWKSRNNL